MPDLLRSKVARSNPATIQLEADLALMACCNEAAEPMHRMRNGAAFITRSMHPSFEGPFATGPYLRIGLCTGPAVRLVQHSGAARLEGIWRPGTVVVGPGHREGIARCDRTRMIGLMIAPEATPLARMPDPDRLDEICRYFHHDALLASVLVAMHEEAETHGASTAFFEHGVALVLRRLGELREPPAIRTACRPLADGQFATLQAFVDVRLGDDLSVADMADALGLEPSVFTKALSARTGYPPYAWLTCKRMEQATVRLAQGWSVIRTANSLGYTNPAKFAAAFRRVKGCSPSQWGKG